MRRYWSPCSFPCSFSASACLPDTSCRIPTDALLHARFWQRESGCIQIRSLNCIFPCFFTVFGFISKPPRSLACRNTLLTIKAILLTEVSKMASRNDAFVKPCFELLRKKSSYPLISEGRRICQLNLLTLAGIGRVILYAVRFGDSSILIDRRLFDLA